MSELSLIILFIVGEEKNILNSHMKDFCNIHRKL